MDVINQEVGCNRVVSTVKQQPSFYLAVLNVLRRYQSFPIRFVNYGGYVLLVLSIMEVISKEVGCNSIFWPVKTRAITLFSSCDCITKILMFSNQIYLLCRPFL